jgi:tRNA 2-selenouridine synthase
VAITKIDILSFLQLQQGHPVLDVRSPGEYTHAHIPGAHNLPLFSDEERTIVGTAYKQQSREIAIKIGLDFFGVKMRQMVEYAEQITQGIIPGENGRKKIIVHCWRGGMRSAAVAWLLDIYGFEVLTINGGYKSFRKWALLQFEQPWPVKVVGGYTGSGKTEFLYAIKEKGAIIIDLEDIAKHRGSAFGKIANATQPGQEMFENLLAVELMKCAAAKYIWVEDESQRIGLVNIPKAFWQTMRKAPVYFIDVSFEERLDHIVKEYGNISKEVLINAIVRISKRLGGLETKTAVNCLLENNIAGCFAMLLKYYDKHYSKALHARDNPETIMQTVTTENIISIITQEQNGH